MNVNLEYYRIFYYVAKYQNFTRAARALENSQLFCFIRKDRMSNRNIL